jgi:hypothetical protein
MAASEGEDLNDGLELGGGSQRGEHRDEEQRSTSMMDSESRRWNSGTIGGIDTEKDCIFRHR